MSNETKNRRGVKICPKCGGENGPRAFKCKHDCDHNFKPGQERKSQPNHPGCGRGGKICPSCSKKVGPRTYECECGHEFAIRATNKTPLKPRKKRKRLVKDWKALDIGVKVKVVGGNGDHYVNESGDRIYMQQKGIYTVLGKDKNGLMVHGKTGRSYIYMGEPKVSELSSMIRKEPHKLMVLA